MGKSVKIGTKVRNRFLDKIESCLSIFKKNKVHVVFGTAYIKQVALDVRIDRSIFAASPEVGGCLSDVGFRRSGQGGPRACCILYLIPMTHMNF